MLAHRSHMRAMCFCSRAASCGMSESTDSSCTTLLTMSFLDSADLSQGQTALSLVMPEGTAEQRCVPQHGSERAVRDFFPALLVGVVHHRGEVPATKHNPSVGDAVWASETRAYDSRTS